MSLSAFAKGLAQVAGIVGLAAVLGLIWNSVSANGITLGRNYFLKIEVQDLPDPTPTVTQDPGGTSELDPTEGPNHGFQSVSVEDMEVYVEAAAEDDTILLLDSRNRDNYNEGHIPGAHFFFHYQSDKLMDGMRDKLDAAQFIIVYCSGGDCEDSILLATSLVSEYGYPFESLYIFEGGMKEWIDNGQPVSQKEP